MLRATILSLCLWAPWVHAAAESVLTLRVPTLADRDAGAFAERLPLALDLRDHAPSTAEGMLWHWQHNIVVRGALALGLEIDEMHLPAGSTLRIGDQQWQGPMQRRHFFTQHQPGERLFVSLRVPQDQLDTAVLSIREVQAAYRDPFAPVSAKATDACLVNAACTDTSTSAPWAASVVALIVMNTSSCTGTLVNNSAGDARPYLLTARHCHANTGADAIRAAGSLRLAWGSVTACGTPLLSAWSSGAVITEGAIHRAQSGDTWLVELSQRPPERAAAWFAGLDASDRTPIGPVTGWHHGNGLQRQRLLSSDGGLLARTADFVGGISLLGWAFAPQEGAAAGGSSGSGLFDAQGRVIGTLSTGVGCSSGKPQVTYARLAAAWSGDGSMGGSLKPWLDPVNAGSTFAGKSFVGQSLPTLVTPPATPLSLESETATAGSWSGWWLLGLAWVRWLIRGLGVARRRHGLMRRAAG